MMSTAKDPGLLIVLRDAAPELLPVEKPLEEFTPAEVAQAIVSTPLARSDMRSPPYLVEFVKTEAPPGVLHTDVHLTLLKLYQYAPPMTDVTVVAIILAKAIAVLPQPDFSLCLFQIPDEVQQSKEISMLIKFENLLNGCRFQEFWQQLSASTTFMSLFTDKIPVWFTEGVQNFIADVVGLTYGMIRIGLLESLLNLKRDTPYFQALMKRYGWTRDGDTIVTPPKDNNVSTPSALAAGKGSPSSKAFSNFTRLVSSDTIQSCVHVLRKL